MLAVYPWLLAAHVIALVLWVGTTTTIYWLLRLHDHAPQAMREKLTLMERSLALLGDICITVVIGCGVALIFGGPDHAGTLNWLTAPGQHGWLHVKLTVVVLALLSVHGILRGRIKKFGMGVIAPIPAWIWSLYLGGLAIAIIAVTTKFQGLGK